MDKITEELTKVSKDILTENKWSLGLANIKMLKGGSAEIDIKLGQETQCWIISTQYNEEENWAKCI